MKEFLLEVMGLLVPEKGACVGYLTICWNMNVQNQFKGEELKLNCRFVTRRKARQSQWISVLQKPNGRGGSSDWAGRSGETTSAILALERRI